ncbi:hypothetical protein GCM10023189_18680 [Nibrella saemangeumensis]|uniref:DUF922 domain-containing protein n=1 Tax=Nibrella saemangeumensis TaxID=1084526 RepID=A0ABP8MNF4_9BACT
MAVWLSAFFTVYFFVGLKPAAEPIVLKAEPLPFTPKEFYIADVIDERPERGGIGHLITTPGRPAERVDLQGGTVPALRQFVRQSLRQNQSLRAIAIRLKQCKITETAATGNRVEGRIVVGMAFDILRDGESVRLVEYQGGARYNRPASQLTSIEPTLRQSLTDALKFLNTWMNQQANQNEKLAKDLKVTFTDYVNTAETDSVFYAVNRPLTWNDFRAKPSGISRYAAAVFPSFGYEGGSETVNGVLNVKLILKVYVLKSSSWVKEVARNDYALNHEQRHFDIVKIVAERFKQRVPADSLTIDDYNSIIQYQYLEAFREMNRLQEQYDGETNHGINQSVQERWNQRIDADLRKYSIK